MNKTGMVAKQIKFYHAVARPNKGDVFLMLMDMPFYLRKALARFCSSSHKLSIEIGHHHFINRADRIRIFCLNQFNIVTIEDEFHAFSRIVRNSMRSVIMV